MRLLRSSFLSAGMLLAFSSVAAADSDWQTVSLDGDPDFTIDVPAVVGKDYLPSAKNRAGGLLMGYLVSTDHWGELYCGVNRVSYSDLKSTRAEIIEKLKAGLGQIFCHGDEKATNVTDKESTTLTSNGFVASRCRSSYTEPGEKKPGNVYSMLIVAAPNNLYEVACTTTSDTQSDAEVAWEVEWSGDAAHVQDSLHLPAREK